MEAVGYTQKDDRKSGKIGQADAQDKLEDKADNHRNPNYIIWRLCVPALTEKQTDCINKLLLITMPLVMGSTWEIVLKTGLCQCSCSSCVQ